MSVMYKLTEPVEVGIDEPMPTKFVEEAERSRARFAGLTDEIEQLKAENAALQVSNEVRADDNAALCKENAKLRELVGVMRTCIRHACLCDFCPLFTSEDMDEIRCIADMDSRMHELGVDE